VVGLDNADGLMGVQLMKRVLTKLCVVTPFLTAQAWGQTVEYIHTDALGSPVAVTNSSGAVIERTVYEPYGAIVNRPLTNGPGFTGHVTDAVTGLVYMQQRYYDPVLGRFLSVDPVTVSEAGSNFNRYWYANDNPYKFTDPDGTTISCDASSCSIVCHSIGECALDYGQFAIEYISRLISPPVQSPVLTEESSSDSDDKPSDKPETPDFTDTDRNQPPFRGEPGSTVRGGTGSRTYGDDGFPLTDRDTGHPDEAGIGSEDHVHDWGRPPDGGQPTHEDRGPSREPRPGDPPLPRGPNIPPPEPPQKM
jgi:RHS repeat-associated protein